MFKNNGLKKLFFYSLIISVLIGCKKDPSSNVQPLLPPFESMQMIDLGGIGNVKKGSTFDHIRAAQAVLGVWHTILTVDFALPFNAFALAAAVKPVQAQDNLWTWTYQVSNGASMSNVVLSGTYLNQSIQWVMTIDNVKYLDGTSTSDRIQGQWNFYKTKTVPYMNIGWAFNSSDKSGKIRYTNVNTSDVERTSYLQLIMTNATDYDANFTAYMKSASKTANIQYSTKNKIGAYKENNGAWLYWDNTFADY